MRGKVKALSLFAKAILASVCLVLIIPSVIHLYPSLVGADGSYIVLGGSMQPALRPGDLAFTEEVDPAEVEVGAIVAVTTDSGVYMHRVVEKVGSNEGVLFRLKGDANEDPDSSYVNGSEIIGKTTFSLPMGYLYTKSGYVLIVATPLMLLAVDQAIKIYKVYDTRKRRRRGLKAILLGKGGRRRRRKIPILDATSALLLMILVAGSTHMMAPYFTSGGGSFFTDTESSRRNTITADAWQVPSTITCNVSNSTVNLGENVTISGVINPPRTVQIEFKLNGTVCDSVSVPTDDSEAYSYVFTPNEAGNWTVKVSWLGDSSYYEASCQATVQVLG